MLCKAQNSQELASCIVLEKQSLIIVDSDCMDMQIKKKNLYTYTQSGRPVLSVLQLQPTADIGLPLAAPLSAVTATETNQRTMTIMSLPHNGGDN